jgi:hypothetical protein
MKFSKKEIIITSWNQILPNLSLLILCMSFILFINIILGVLQEKLLEDLSAQSIIFTISSYMFQGGLGLGVISIYLNLYNNKVVKFVQIFESFNLLFSYVLGYIIIIISMLTLTLPGILILILYSGPSSSWLLFLLIFILIFPPIIYLSIRLQFFSYFLVDKECGALEALKRSMLITKGVFLELLTLGALVTIIVLISFIPLGVGLVFSIPLSIMVTTNLYNILQKNI